MTVCGVTSAFTMGVIVDKTEKYRLVHLCLLALIVISAYMTLYALSKEIVWFIVFTCVILGAADFGFRPVSISYGVELTFPM